MIRARALLMGAIVFAAMHFTLVAEWRWFGDGIVAPWFMNAGRAVAFAVVVFVAAGAVVAVRARTLASALLSGANLTAGAVVVMVVVLFNLPGGPGTIFPIVIAVGAIVLAGSCCIGSFVSAVLMGRR